jgi:DNA-binding XRE family transcriptional regulator
MADQPTLARRALALAFLRLRTAAGKTPAEVGVAVAVSRQTIGRIEDGDKATRLITVKALCDYYGVSRDEKSRLCELATRSKEKGWWEPFFDKTQGTITRPKSPLFLETEREAVRIWVLELEVIPGLLQTMEYLRELQAAGLPMPQEIADAAQGLRAHRQAMLDNRADAPEIEFIIGRAAMDYLEQLPKEVREGQMERIREVAARPNVTVRVITGLHAATAGSFTVLEPADEMPPFVYLDAVDGCRYVEDPVEGHDVVSLYERTFVAARESTEII